MDELKKIAIKLGTDGPVKTESTPRRVQLLFNGVYIVRTIKAKFVWEHPYYPQLYIPTSEFPSTDKCTLTKGEAFTSDDGKTLGTQWTLKVGSKSIDKIIAFSADLTGKASEIADFVKVDFASVDQWFEEDTPIFVHPKDPYRRVDVLQSSRHVKVSVGGKVVAESATAAHLYETGLPVRFYLPFTALDASVLRPSETRTKCPYKGEAEYYSVEVDGKLHEDIVWYYTRPTLESAKVEGLCCFYNEKVDIELDGEKLEVPVTHFSKNKGPPSIV